MPCGRPFVNIKYIKNYLCYVQWIQWTKSTEISPSLEISITYIYFCTYSILLMIYHACCYCYFLLTIITVKYIVHTMFIVLIGETKTYFPLWWDNKVLSYSMGILDNMESWTPGKGSVLFAPHALVSCLVSSDKMILYCCQTLKIVWRRNSHL